MGILWQVTRGAVMGICRLSLWLSNWLWSRLTWRSQALEQRLIRDQQREISGLRSDVELKERQIGQMAEIITRDRERIAAETAIQSRRKVEAESDPRASVISGFSGEEQ